MAYLFYNTVLYFFMATANNACFTKCFCVPFFTVTYLISSDGEKKGCDQGKCLKTLPPLYAGSLLKKL